MVSASALPSSPSTESSPLPPSLPRVATDLPALSVSSPSTPTPTDVPSDPIDTLVPALAHLSYCPPLPMSASSSSGPESPSASRAPAAPPPTRTGSLSRPMPGNPGGVKVPPGLAAKMAAMAKRHDSHPSSRPDHRLDSSPFMPPQGPSCVPRSTSAPAPFPSLTPRRQKPLMRLNDLSAGPSTHVSFAERPKFLGVGGPTPFANFSKIVDPSGRLNFGGKAVVHSKGVDFSNGSSFSINMDELTLMEELGKGNYGTVQKVFHKPTKVVMAMKEIRLELDHSKLKAILTELDILHRASSDTIVEFYGAFFIESCVYYCMEYMDGGSLDKLAGAEVPEAVLATVTGQVVEGLRFLKDELQTMHRDVKPTNVLINRRGQTKLCDFGVSGQLERSLAKTNIGCQSYMAPERIQGEQAGAVSAYTVASDVWSLGLSIIEFAIGHYPYPPETYSNIFAQLNAIVHGEPPSLPDGIYSEQARDFVGLCLKKEAELRPSYGQLLEHRFLVDRVQVDMVAWVEAALAEVKAKSSKGG